MFGCVLLLLASTTAMAGQAVQTFYVDKALWDTNGNHEASLPHLRSVGEGCVAALRDDLLNTQKNDPTHLWRYVLRRVGQDDGGSNFDCTGTVDVYSHGWIQKHFYDTQGAYVRGFTSSVNCVLLNYTDTENGQCGPPKKCCISLANPIDAASGNKHQVETDYVGAGAFPLHFERIYDSSRTWTNNPVPIGVAWTHTYLASIYFMAEEGGNTIDQAVAYRPDGTILRFNFNGSVWTADADVAERLSVTFDSDDAPSATLINTDDSVERYDNVGRLISITNRDGLTQTLSYVTTSGTYANDVQLVTDPQGHTLTFGYNASGQLASLTDGNGATIKYGYDSGTGNLTSVMYPEIDGTWKTRNYLYNESGQVAVPWPNALTGISEEITTGNFQRYASWGYDSDGRATSSMHGPYTSGNTPGIDKTTLTFNPDGTTSFTDALQQTRKYTFEVLYRVAHPAVLDTLCDSCSAHDKTRSYDPITGYSTASTDFNDHGTNYSFTSNTTSGVPGGGLETQRIEGVAADTSAKRTINTTWNNPNFRVPTLRTVEDASGTTMQMTKWVYNGRGQPTFRCLVDPTNDTAVLYTCGSQTNAPIGVRQWGYTYCESGGGCPLVGLLLTSKGPRTDITTDVTTYVYYSSTDLSGCATLGGVCHYLGDLQTVTNAQNQVTTYTSYDKDGRLTRITDPNGVPTDMSYHPRGWLTQLAVRNANSGTSTSDRITTYAYDGAGEVTQITQPFGDFQVFRYDLAHRLTDVTNRMNEHLQYVLDNAGNRTEEYFYNSNAQVKRHVLRDYDALGHLSDVKNLYVTPATLAMTYFYDGNGNVQQAKDGRNHITINTYDPRNRLVKVDQDNGATDEAVTSYTYDALDRLIDVQDPQTLQTLHTIYTFDGLGNQTQLSSPDTGITTYTYDAAGNRIGRVDARLVASGYAYDALNRLTAIAYPATPSLNVGYTWDTVATGCVSPNRVSKGRLATVTDGSGSTTFCFNRFGDTALKTQTIAGAAFPVSYAYNRDGTLNSETEPNGTLVTYTRDNNNRIKAVSYQLSGQPSATTLISAVTYDPFGPANKITYGNGRTLSRTYDLDGVVKTVVDGSTVGDGLNLTFGRDKVGNLIQVKTSPTVGNKSYYDGLNRLIEMDASDLSSTPQWRYTYDPTGDRLSVQAGTAAAVSYTYPMTSHRLSAVGATGRQYDADGNTTGIGSGATGLSFFYNDTNRMDQVQVNGVQARLYQTNAFGQRVLKSKTGDASQTRETVYDEQGHILGDFNASNAIVDEYLWMDDLPVGVVDGTTSTVKQIEPDHLGTPRTVIDPATNLAIWSWPILNDPFGQAQPVNLNGSHFVLNLRFPGQVYDAESGMNYNYFRDYDSGTGRYVESDPVGLKAGVATYSYVLSSPEMLDDPTGLFTVLLDGDCKECKAADSNNDNLKNKIQAACSNLRGITNVHLRNCIDNRCKSKDSVVTIQCRCFVQGSGEVRGAYPSVNEGCPRHGQPGGNITVCRQSRRGLIDPGPEAIHEWAHSCNWGHMDPPSGVPNPNSWDNTSTGTRCDASKPIGYSLPDGPGY